MVYYFAKSKNPPEDYFSAPLPFYSTLNTPKVGGWGAVFNLFWRFGLARFRHMCRLVDT